MPIFVVLLWHIDYADARTAMRAPKEIPTPARIKKLVTGQIERTTTVDFDGDGKPDFIVYVRDKRKTDEEADILGEELWITSTLKIVKRRPGSDFEYQYMWFINLDDDPIPEIITAFGYADGITYSIYKQTFGNKKEDELLLQFNPVIDASDEGKYYWGYPWDLSDLKARRVGSHFEMLCSFDHKIEGDEGGDDNPPWQRQTPVIFFEGKTTQPEATVNEVGTKKWMDLKTITRKARSGER